MLANFVGRYLSAGIYQAFHDASAVQHCSYNRVALLRGRASCWVM